jgi:RNA recognition motif-containing protein
MTDKYLLYLYDLPRDTVTSIKISELLKKEVKETSFEPPQIRRDANKPFYTAVLKFNEPNDFKNAVEKFKYFEFEGKQCRALPFDKDLLGSNRINTNKNNVFVKRLPDNMTSKDLDQVFSDNVGKVKSAKVSINGDYSSRKYGFVCF